MEPRPGSSPSPSSSILSVHKVLLLLIGTIIQHNGSSVDAYVPSFGIEIHRRTAPNTLHRVVRTPVRLYSNDPLSDTGETSSPLFLETTTDGSKTMTQDAKFGDVMPVSRKSSSTTATAQFGDVVSLQSPSSSSSSTTTTTPAFFSSSSPSTAATSDKTKTDTKKPTVSDAELLRQRKMRNIAVAILSVFLAAGNYAYQWTHPITPIQLLVSMERSSAPLSDIGTNSKPTVIDFWAPWCENCRYMAPTLLQVEENYKDRVNFVMVNGDDPNNWPLIEALGVDAIPHMAMIESDGTVDTALIGTVPKEWLSRDIDVLLDNAKSKPGPEGCAVPAENESAEVLLNAAEAEPCGKRALPFQMLDVFAHRQDARKLVNLDAVVEAGRMR